MSVTPHYLDAIAPTSYSAIAFLLRIPSPLRESQHAIHRRSQPSNLSDRFPVPGEVVHFCEELGTVLVCNHVSIVLPAIANHTELRSLFVFPASDHCIYSYSSPE